MAEPARSMDIESNPPEQAVPARRRWRVVAVPVIIAAVLACAAVAVLYSDRADLSTVRRFMAGIPAPLSPPQPVFAQEAMATAPVQSPQQQAQQQEQQQAQQSGGIRDWRYSEFIKAVEEDTVEKVTFTPDGKRIMAVDTDGQRYKLDAIPNDPELLNDLTKHKVDITVLPAGAMEGASNGAIATLLFPALLFGGIWLITRRPNE